MMTPQPPSLEALMEAAVRIDNVRRELEVSRPPRENRPGNSSKTSSAPNKGTSTGTPVKPGDPHYVSKEEIDKRRANNQCIKCGREGHRAAVCRTGWKAPGELKPKEDKGKETAKIAEAESDSEKDIEFVCISKSNITPLLNISIQLKGQAEINTLIDSGATANFISPTLIEQLKIPTITLDKPRTVTMLDGSNPKQGKIWKKANLTFSFDGRTMTHDFLVSPIGSHSAILGIKWLEKESPEIDWSTRQLSLPIASPEIATIAQEEEADDSPLSGIPEQYHVYAKVFGEEEFNKLPPHRHYDIGIELTDEGPLNSPLYSMTDAESVTLKEWLEAELKAGKIRPSKSSISSPVMFVPKKDGSRRLVVDYRRLNNRTKKNVYPLPRPDDLMSKLRGAKIFTKLDLRWGYNNVRVKEGDEWKTAFRTKYGLFESLVMTFGLTNAPAAFQYFMNDLFQDLLDVYVIIYLDDILIFSKNEAEHEFHVHEVLQRLETAQLFCKGSKCEFHRTRVEYLGIIVSDQGFSLDKLKIQAVQEWPIPTTVKQVQSFLGFANFLRRFVANFSHMARPLHNLVKKETSWKWTEKEQAAFEGLKQAITEAPVLAHANPDKPYFLETDASGAALGSNRSKEPRLTMIRMTKNSWLSSAPSNTGEFT
ncbi:Retrotransposable element Tf2 155 kDa protein type 1 OS=Schizosaccharomyces pombe (strain 972 / ATCC 24843) GN=Tf2-1 PE=4 SV=1 [Rhizoctonia solani AG-1 IB]|uniref:Retrotransposable element Tf2 155 kDa protein type 1 n=1 Tax=Thanatephorus cucumeris (strain AG1-IB / isolate 7/3/14) TaxID=1108050 RepID=A0A0B7FWH5_THACB|nr:Retrotransposable element Tf2 155 kDa protein type 1 OS=Schizosaccharomyces pombe (strain 972 / ATCC 24843) GN=Tf2-1 PE=4 SV=1 [Rhizoctonia solani AG-1 IB]